MKRSKVVYLWLPGPMINQEKDENNSPLMLCCFVVTAHVKAHKFPSFEEVISLQSLSNAVISPDGNHIVFESQTVDWKENRYDTELWISKQGDLPFQLTNNLKNSSGQWQEAKSLRGRTKTVPS